MEPGRHGIAFASQRADNGTENNNWHIWVVSAQGGTAQQLTSGPFDDQDPSWSPDGSISRSEKCDDPNDSEIYVINADGSKCAPADDPSRLRRASRLARSETFMRLSVCCMTGDPPERGAALAPLRAIADQIVVAVDARVDDDRLGAYDVVADEIYRFKFRPSVERPWRWLASRRHGEWILWLDGDEVLSPAFVAALPELIVDTELTQYWFTCRWLFPDTDHWIDENPWWPDFQVRLIRNKPFTMWFGRMHEAFGSSLPARHLDLPIYHLTCVVTSVSERLAKAASYDAVAPGRVSPGGGPFNQVLQVPERYATLRPQLVPADDRAAIDDVLAAPRRIGPSGLDIVWPPTPTVDAVSPERELSDDDYRARVTLIERDTRFAPGCPRSLLGGCTTTVRPPGPAARTVAAGAPRYALAAPRWRGGRLGRRAHAAPSPRAARTGPPRRGGHDAAARHRLLPAHDRLGGRGAALVRLRPDTHGAGRRSVAPLRSKAQCGALGSNGIHDCAVINPDAATSEHTLLAASLSARPST